MRVLSLFDGIATGRLALEMAGVPVDLYIASEIDKDAKAVARANWPDMIHIGPVENVTAPDLPKIDLVIGGSPCQGFSRAGAGLNFDDPRSRLFFDYVRVLNEVREKNPDVKFLLENVIMKREWRTSSPRSWACSPSTSTAAHTPLKTGRGPTGATSQTSAH